MRRYRLIDIVFICCFDFFLVPGPPRRLKLIFGGKNLLVWEEPEVKGDEQENLTYEVQCGTDPTVKTTRKRMEFESINSKKFLGCKVRKPSW